jgi:hypothetical protein
MKLHGAINTPPAIEQLEPEQSSTLCVVLSGNPQRLQPLLEAGWVLFGEDGLRKMTAWMDDYVNVLEPFQEGIKRKYLAWKMSPSAFGKIQNAKNRI